MVQKWQLFGQLLQGRKFQIVGRWSKKKPNFCQRSERMTPNKVEIVSRTVRNWALIKACPTLIVMELIASQPIIFHRLVFRWDMTTPPDNHWADHKTGWAHKILYDSESPLKQQISCSAYNNLNEFNDFLFTQ